MKRNLFVIKFICLITTCLLSSQSLAIMTGMSTEELTRASEIVIRGEVENVQVQWSKDGETIFTSVTIRSIDFIKGKSRLKKIKVEYEGGEIGDIGLRVSDTATLNKWEKVILFLKSGKSKKGGIVFHMVGRGQGKYTIGNDGIARKKGFSIISGEEMIDNNIPEDVLIDKIKKIK